MAKPISVQGLFETHLTVSNLQRSIRFYQDIVGLQLALEVSDRNAAFFWIGDSKNSMLGLWSIGNIPMGLNLHIAFEVMLDDLMEASNRLKSNGITPLSFFGEKTAEPSVIGWMPAAAIYFRDPDNHLIEYLTMLDHSPRPDLGIIPWSDWLVKSKPS
ncbi:MAG TPA: VOC family protein [Nitrososphaeraceae archaeon]|nr:VOC family protein [Nitrososphaeraceae archaeon]